MKKTLLTFVVVLSAVLLHAQFTYDYLKAADNYFRSGDYYSAAQYYEKYLHGDKAKGGAEEYNPYVIQASLKKGGTAVVSSREQAVYNLAESYRHLNYHVKAEPYYKMALEFDREKYPLVNYHYATTLRALEKYAEAEQSLNQFLGTYQQNDQYAETARREILNLKFIQAELAKKDLNLYKVNKAMSGGNSAAFYAPVFSPSGELVITSTAADNSAEKTQVHNNRIYTATYTGEGLAGLNKLGLPEPKDVHQGAATLSADGNTMYFTRWTGVADKKTASIYVSKKEGSSWSTPTEVSLGGGSINQQPHLSSDGKTLYFISNNAGGQGGLDIWMGDADGSSVSNIRNAGSVINTAFDEEAPYFHSASNTLVFASKGRVGMGGYDLFYTKMDGGAWSNPVNFGYPVNSVKDDIYFASKGTQRNILEHVILSSDRDAECCLELYALSKEMPLKQIKGLVVSCDDDSPLGNVSVSIIDTINNKTVYTSTTGVEGSYAFTLEDYQPLKVIAKVEGYEQGELTFYAPGDPETLVLNNPALCLVKIREVGTVEVLDNVYYEFNKAYLLDESKPALDKLLRILNQNPTMVIEIGGHTDNLGTNAYNQRLSEARAQSVVDYLIENGIERSRLVAKGYGELQPVAPNQNADGSDNPEGREKNRRTEFKVLSK